MTPDRSPPEMQTCNLIIGVDKGSDGGDETAIALMLPGGRMFTIPDPFASVLLPILSAAPFPVEAIRCTCRDEHNRTWWCECPVHGDPKVRRHAEQAAQPAGALNVYALANENSILKFENERLRKAAQPESVNADLDFSQKVGSAIAKAICAKNPAFKGEGLLDATEAVIAIITRAEQAQGSTGDHIGESNEMVKAPTSPASDAPKPCPFCGGKAEILTMNAPRVGCPRAMCRGNSDLGIWGNMPDAIRAWNTRAPQPSSPEPVAGNATETDFGTMQDVDESALHKAHGRVVNLFGHYVKLEYVREIIDSYLREAGAAMPQAGGEVWHLIASAPKTSPDNKVDVWGDYNGMTGRWCNSYCYDGIWFCSEGEGYALENVTHFMPIPKPPASAGSEGAEV